MMMKRVSLPPVASAPPLALEPSRATRSRTFSSDCTRHRAAPAGRGIRALPAALAPLTSRLKSDSSRENSTGQSAWKREVRSLRFGQAGAANLFDFILPLINGGPDAPACNPQAGPGGDKDPETTLECGHEDLLAGEPSSAPCARLPTETGLSPRGEEPTAGAAVASNEKDAAATPPTDLPLAPVPLAARKLDLSSMPTPKGPAPASRSGPLSPLRKRPQGARHLLEVFEQEEAPLNDALRSQPTKRSAPSALPPLSATNYEFFASLDEALGCMPPGTSAHAVRLRSKEKSGPAVAGTSKAAGKAGRVYSSGTSLVFVPDKPSPSRVVSEDNVSQFKFVCFSNQCFVPADRRSTAERPASDLMKAHSLAAPA